MPRLAPKLVWIGLLTPALFGFDFATKEAAHALGPADVVPVWEPWLSFVHAENPGAAFSTMVPLPLLVVAGLVGLGLILQLVRRMPDRAHLPAVSAALLLGGGLGNQIDRIGDGTVTDFIRVSAGETPLGLWLVDHAGAATWPIFNLADVYLVVGLGMLFVLPRAALERLAGSG